MSEPAYIGKTAPTTLQLAEGYPKRTREGDSWVFTWRYWCPNSKAHDNTGGLIPARNAAMPPVPGFESGTYFLNTVSVTATPVAGMVFVDFKYSESQGSGLYQFSGHAHGDIEKSLQKTYREIDPQKALELGLITVISPAWNSVGLVGVEYTYTFYEKDFDWTLANCLQYLCQIGKHPTSITEMPGITEVEHPDAGGDDGVPADLDGYDKWLCTGQTIRTDGGDITQIGTNYGWDRAGWEGLAIF